jgi:hypothetical protein
MTWLISHAIPAARDHLHGAPYKPVRQIPRPKVAA